MNAQIDPRKIAWTDIAEAAAKKLTAIQISAENVYDSGVRGAER